MENGKFFEEGLKSGGCKVKKVGDVNTQNTPGFGTPVCMHIFMTELDIYLYIIFICSIYITSVKLKYMGIIIICVYAV